MGPSGVAVGPIEPITTNDDEEFINLEVKYDPNLKLYQMFAQKSTGSVNSEIDYLDSADGVNWVVRVEDIIERGMTPSWHPDTACWVYYGKTSNSYQANIYLKVWC